MGKCGENRKGIKKALLITSLAVNLGILGFFKYFNFFAQSFERVVAPLGLHPDFVTLNILLPVGISFYTFQTMAYVIDVYRGNEKPCKNFCDFALYVSFFPQLVAGPIERSTNLIPQFQKQRSITRAMIYSACQLILMGYFKKVFIADGVAPIVNECFATPDKFGGVTLLLGTYLFAIQIYGDFAGYTDIARGVSRLFGIELMLNFRQPYLSTNITEFWRRWHISLSCWLRDYLYISLGGNRKGKARTYINNLITMLLGGLWHGAALHFIVWGGLHGIYLAVHKWLLGGRKPEEWTPWENPRSTIVGTPFLWDMFKWFVNVFITFNLVCIALIFFRADGCYAAIHYISNILHTGRAGIADVWLYFCFYGTCVLILDLLCSIQKSEVPFTEKWNPIVRGFGYACILFLLVFIGENDVQPFIYFQF
jgi:D-alanyl-lipoteichoic acid acyltransferase DltB (MBOAT superfamily)